MLFPGFYGAATGLAVLLLLCLVVHLKTPKVPKGTGFHFDA
ncbi:MAG: hypothetical protein JWP08_1986, partial [Bryobacterales bacterium]|nr:hypothetical protein [Bryobacterales bacterium]